MVFSWSLKVSDGRSWSLKVSQGLSRSLMVAHGLSWFLIARSVWPRSSRARTRTRDGVGAQQHARYVARWAHAHTCISDIRSGARAGRAAWSPATQLSCGSLQSTRDSPVKTKRKYKKGPRRNKENERPAGYMHAQRPCFKGCLCLLYCCFPLPSARARASPVRARRVGLCRKRKHGHTRTREGTRAMAVL